MTITVTVFGRLGRDPETRYTKGGTAITNLSIASTERWSKNGVKQERTTWLRAQAWDKLGLTLTEYFKQGDRIMASGTLRNNEWTDENGKKRVDTEFVISDFDFVEQAKPVPLQEAANF